MVFMPSGHQSRDLTELIIRTCNGTESVPRSGICRAGYKVRPARPVVDGPEVGYVVGLGWGECVCGGRPLLVALQVVDDENSPASTPERVRPSHQQRQSCQASLPGQSTDPPAAQRQAATHPSAAPSTGSCMFQMHGSKRCLPRLRRCSQQASLQDARAASLGATKAARDPRGTRCGCRSLSPSPAVQDENNQQRESLVNARAC